jgi:bifunctional UDP-N-acetylglucosamine pyrophosphorylase/glucosamine-1-phosphate N-acetyltransferase/UDP-N-acetylglucosamine pyrophosphorylase
MDAPIAIVLAAGKGTRMKSDLPKVLCEANGRPLVAYVVDALRTAGVEKTVAVVGYRADLVESMLGSAYENIEFALQSEQLGTGHAVMMCRDLIQHHDGPIVVVAGDSPMLQSDSIRALLNDFAAHHPACLLGTLTHPDPTGLGRIVRDSAGNFTGIVEEKDATDAQRKINEVNMSTYVFDCRQLLWALDKLTDDNRQKEYYITDVPGILLKAGQDVRALAVLKPIEALSVNTVEHLADVERELRKSCLEDRLTDA